MILVFQAMYATYLSIVALFFANTYIASGESKPPIIESAYAIIIHIITFPLELTLHEGNDAYRHIIYTNIYRYKNNKQPHTWSTSSTGITESTGPKTSSAMRRDLSNAAPGA
jgi:hypothetical protein